MSDSFSELQSILRVLATFRNDFAAFVAPIIPAVREKMRTSFALSKALYTLGGR
jgi:hypothetical protein